MSDYNPYTPPTHDDDATHAIVGGAASWDGKLLVVPKQFGFPNVCLKCASTAVNARRTQKFAFTPTWARMLVIVCWPAALVAMVLSTKKATLELPLCDACEARWQGARKWSALLLTGMIVGIVIATTTRFGLDPDTAGIFVAVAILALALGLAFGLSKLVRPHMIHAKKIDDINVTLLGVNAIAGERVARGASS